MICTAQPILCGWSK